MSIDDRRYRLSRWRDSRRFIPRSKSSRFEGALRADRQGGQDMKRSKFISDISPIVSVRVFRAVIASRFRNRCVAPCPPVHPPSDASTRVLLGQIRTGYRSGSRHNGGMKTYALWNQCKDGLQWVHARLFKKDSKSISVIFWIQEFRADLLLQVLDFKASICGLIVFVEFNGLLWEGERCHQAWDPKKSSQTLFFFFFFFFCEENSTHLI